MNIINPTGLLRVEAPHYVAASIWERGRCVRAAPIIRWMEGKPWNRVHGWLFARGYAWQWVKETNITPEIEGELQTTEGGTP